MSAGAGVGKEGKVEVEMYLHVVAVAERVVVVEAEGVLAPLPRKDIRSRMCARAQVPRKQTKRTG